MVFITAPATASKKISREIIRHRLAACVNITSKVRSIYRWKGKIEQSDESLLIVKTRRALLPKLHNLMRKVHPYTVPEIIALPILNGNKTYLQWLAQETR